MALMKNMTEEEVNKMSEHFYKEIAPNNSYAEFKPFDMTDKEKYDLLEANVASLELQVSDLTEYIKSVFDGHVLIDGRFVKITV